MKSSTLAVITALVFCAAAPAVPARADECTAVLTDPCLEAALSDMGYAPKKLSKGYLLALKRGNPAWTVNMQVVLSDDSTKLGLNANLGLVPNDGAVSADVWKQLLISNEDIDPSAFYFDGERKKLYLHRVSDNRYVTRERLRHEIETFADTIYNTRELWKFTQ